MSEGWEITTRQVLRDLVSDGKAPNGVLPADCGPLWDTVQVLYDAHSAGGTETVREVWNTLTRADSRLEAYLASNETEASALRWAREALEPQPPVDWLIEDVIAAGTVTVVVGEPGAKKTWLLLDATVCVAQGEPWLDRPTRQVTVLLIDEESGSRRLNRRLGAVMRAHSAGKGLPLAYVTMSGLSLLEPDAADKLVQLIQAAGAGFVVIDALADVMLGGDENAVRDVQRVFHNLRLAAERTGAAIVVIHHTSKAGGYRGSSAIAGAIDGMLLVESKPTSPNIDISTLKSRDTEPFNLYAVARFEDEVTVITSSTAAPAAEVSSASESYVLGFLADNGDKTMADIKSGAKTCSPDAARQAVYALVKKRRVARKDAGGPGQTGTYGLNGPGNPSKPV